MSLFSSGKESRTVLIKLHKLTGSVSATVRDAPSEYAYPGILYAEARAYLYSDLSKCLKLARKASRLYSEEAALALRYRKIKSAAESSQDGEVKKQRDEYIRNIRKGNYSAASRNLGRLENMKQIFGYRTVLSVRIDKTPYPKITVRNPAAGVISVDSVSVLAERTECVRGTSRRDLWPGQSYSIRLDVPEGSKKAYIRILYFSDGSRHEESFEEVLRWKRLSAALSIPR